MLIHCGRVTWYCREDLDYHFPNLHLKKINYPEVVRDCDFIKKAIQLYSAYVIAVLYMKKREYTFAFYLTIWGICNFILKQYQDVWNIMKPADILATQWDRASVGMPLIQIIWNIFALFNDTGLISWRSILQYQWYAWRNTSVPLIWSCCNHLL